MATRNLYREDLVRKLYEQGKSPYEIAEEIGTNHMNIRRILKKIGVVMRDRAEAQSNGLKTGRCRHPKACNPTEDNYNKIESLSEFIDNIPTSKSLPDTDWE